MNKKKFFKFSGYIFFSFIAYFLFLYTLFPYNALVPFISNRIKANSSIELNISSIRPAFPLGVTATGIVFISQKGEKLYNFNQITAKIPLLSLITFKPEVNYLIRKEKSELSGTIKNITGPLLDIKLLFNSSLMGELLKGVNSMPIIFPAGKISAEGNLSVSQERAIKGNFFKEAIVEGKIFITSEDGALTIPGVPLSNLRDFSYEHIETELLIKKGVLTVDQFDIKGDLEGSIKGKIFFESPLNQSRVDFRLKLKPSEDLKKRAGIIMEIIKGRMEKDGSYSLDIRGNFLQPKPII